MGMGLCALLISHQKSSTLLQIDSFEKNLNDIQKHKNRILEFGLGIVVVLFLMSYRGQLVRLWAHHWFAPSKTMLRGQQILVCTCFLSVVYGFTETYSMTKRP